MEDRYGFRNKVLFLTTWKQEFICNAILSIIYSRNKIMESS